VRRSHYAGAASPRALTATPSVTPEALPSPGGQIVLAELDPQNRRRIVIPATPAGLQSDDRARAGAQHDQHRDHGGIADLDRAGEPAPVRNLVSAETPLSDSMLGDTGRLSADDHRRGIAGSYRRQLAAQDAQEAARCPVRR
jgi:hypothetical protein